LAEKEKDEAISIDQSEKDNLQVDESDEKAIDSEADNVELKQLQSLLNYYQDGLKFSRQINECCAIVCELLGSANKAEVITAIKFFVVAYRYDIEGSKVYIK
jgi:condensin complex subunit 1